MMVDTIKSAYNYKERLELNRLYDEQAREVKRLMDEIDEIDDDEEFDRRYAEEVDPAIEEKHKRWLRCFAAQFHRCKNAWFSTVIKGFEVGKWNPISEKQYYCFLKYASDEDNDTWRTKTTYCRCDGKLVSLIWKNSNRAIKIEEL